jgi:hypothetical protein
MYQGYRIAYDRKCDRVSQDLWEAVVHPVKVGHPGNFEVPRTASNNSKCTTVKTRVTKRTISFRIPSGPLSYPSSNRIGSCEKGV